MCSLPLIILSSVYAECEYECSNRFSLTFSATSSIDVTLTEVAQTHPKPPNSPTMTGQYRGHFVMTTKRSHTPVISASDPESDCENTLAAPLKPITQVSPLSNTNGYFTPAVSYVIRPTFLRPPSRTTTSLDNVDMWESDSESDHSQGFDKINSAAIVPSMTIDFSDLRRSRSPVVAHKRNRLESVNADRKDSPTAALRERITAAMIREPRPRPHSRGPRKVRTPVPKPQRCCFIPIRHEKRRETLESAAVNGHIDKKASPGSTIANPRKTTIVSTAQVSGNESSQVFARSKLVKHSRDFVTSNAPPTRLSSDRSPTKVTFNEYVTVTDGKMNTLDLLHSSSNTAQIFKKRFLCDEADPQRHTVGNSESHAVAEFPT